MNLSQLSVEEIRRYVANGDAPVSPQILAKLKRDPRQGVRKLYEALKKRHEREKEERLRLDAMLNFERILWRSGIERIAGVDEAGTGPLAGPVVAAAVVFPPHVELYGIDDSKRLDPAERTRLAEEIRNAASSVGIGVADVGEIDRLNVYHAALLAMRRAVKALGEPPQHILVDARTIPDLDIPQNPFNKGDGLNFSIAAASIIAKTHRDSLMDDLDRRYPGYGFAKHKGYSTPEHQDAIRRLGPSPVHRMSFTFIRELCGEYSARFYALKEQLEDVQDASALGAFEAALKQEREQLDDNEYRKLKLMVARRWKAL